MLKLHISNLKILGNHICGSSGVSGKMNAKPDDGKKIIFEAVNGYTGDGIMTDGLVIVHNGKRKIKYPWSMVTQFTICDDIDLTST